MWRVILGLLGGAAAGAALGLLVRPSGRQRGRIQGGPAGLLDRARRTFEESRARARSSAREATEASGAGAVQVQHTAEGAVTAVVAPVQGFAEALKARWREAVAEGRQASAEKQEELRRRYLEDTKRA